MNRRWSGMLVAAAVLFVASAHVGSPDTVFEGAAGPYRVRVIVRPPGIVPGLAEITVRLLSGSGLQSVLVLPLRGGRPTAEEPPPDSAKPTLRVFCDGFVTWIEQVRAASSLAMRSNSSALKT